MSIRPPQPTAAGRIMAAAAETQDVDRPPESDLLG
jgi:hypothetical protein